MVDELPPNDEPQPFVDRRVNSRSEMMEVVMTVVATLNEVITALRGEITALANNEERGRQRLTWYLVVLGLVGIVSVVGIGLNYTEGKDVKSIVHYIQECQTPDTECKKRADATTAAAVNNISASVFAATACLQRVPIDQRTDQKIQSCRDQHIGAQPK